MPTPLHHREGEFLKALGHPTRISVFELLSEREHTVREILAEVGVGASNLSHQLAALRRAGVVVYRREGSNLHYSLASPQVAELLSVARGILTTVLPVQAVCEGTP